MKSYQTNMKRFRIVSEPSDFSHHSVTDSKSASDFCKSFWSDDIDVFESFFILLLNRSQKTIGYAKISQGGVCGTVADPIIICKYICDSLAKGVILLHNHPSGNIHPSEEDKKLTKKIQQAVYYFDCKVIDHLILTPESYYSFADEGIL